MARDPISLTIPDLSAFAKSLRAGLPAPPSHLETLSLIARAAGYRNYQHLRARLAAVPPPPVVALDDKRLARAARHFDGQGRFARWPRRVGLQTLCLWVIWAQLPARTDLSEREISDRIHAMCSFRDAAHIRRGMVEHGMFTRTRDGSVYRRVEQAPPPEAQALMARVTVQV